MEQGVGKQTLKQTYKDEIKVAITAIEAECPPTWFCKGSCIATRIIEGFLTDLGSRGKHSWYKGLQKKRTEEEDAEEAKAQAEGRLTRNAYLKQAAKQDKLAPIAKQEDNKQMVEEWEDEGEIEFEVGGSKSGTPDSNGGEDKMFVMAVVSHRDSW